MRNYINKKVIIAISFATIMVMVGFTGLVYFNLENTNNKVDTSNKPDNLPGLMLNNNTKCVYKQSTTKSGSGGCIWSTLYVYRTGNNHLIWILEDTINAYKSNWIAGNVPDGGSHYSGREHMCNAGYSIPVYGCGGTLPFNQNGFIPLNTISSGISVQKVTYGVSYGGGEVVCGARLSSKYSVEFSYTIPQFDLKPWSHSASQTESKLSDNCFNDGKPMSVTWYTVATTPTGNGQITMEYKSYATFAHVGDFWITAYNNVCGEEYASFSL